MGEILTKNNEKILMLVKRQSDNRNAQSSKLNEDDKGSEVQRLQEQLHQLREQKSKLAAEKAEKEKKYRETSQFLQAKLKNLESRFAQYIKMPASERF